jgi:hypothetical protein
MLNVDRSEGAEETRELASVAVLKCYALFMTSAFGPILSLLQHLQPAARVQFGAGTLI